ncbi:MAG: DNA-directed RNA polymerase subunit alpha C-terminal domain-containing protein [Sphingomonadaceae bacterium]|nr:DNA-directed RNA polymerase subunit alpha C-terminal domain-containing protein [Sphingomonadaceae bacterium]
MATPVRAFLMLRDGSGDWDVTVHHDLEGVVRSWEIRSKEVTCGVLHVGFERRLARTFGDAADRYPGRILLTPGAKGALPQAFKTSTHPVATVADEALFLGLDGWGYVEPEPDVLECKTPTFSGWLELYVAERSDDADQLAETGIIDDSTYLRYENGLDRELRKRLGIYRLNATSAADDDDPCAVARAAPPWLTARAVEELNLTVRIANVFRDRGIETVAQLQSFTEAELRRFPNFGRTSARQLVAILREATEDGPLGHGIYAEQEATGTLLDSIRTSLLQCTARERDIMVRRMGLDCEPETLQEISGSYGITRERVRQIESALVARLVRQEVWDDLLASKLKLLLSDRDFPLPLIGAEALDPWFTGVGTQPSAIRYLIANMCTTGAALVEIGGIDYLSFLSQSEWHELLSSARHLLESGVGVGWSRVDCERYVTSLLPENGREFATLLWEAASAWCHFADSGENQTLISYGRGAEQLVEAILQESETPLHYSEITALASKRSARGIDERRAHSAAAQVSHLFGPGTYGLLKHLPVSRGKCDALADEAAEIVTSGPATRQWHTSELLQELLERDVDVPAEFNKYHLDIALKLQGALTSLGRMMWVSPQEAAEAARLDIRQAIISLLLQAGRPLTESELRQRMIAVRGINHGMQFAAVDPIIKLDSSTWGLNDRDLSLKRPEQLGFLERVADWLRNRESGIHISDCADAFGDLIPPRALFCLASCDPRFQVNPGRILGLREWEPLHRVDS